MTSMAIASPPPVAWQPFLNRYRQGEWRGPIFRDLILQDARRLRDKPTLLDIGCGKGFDNDLDLQKSLAAVAGEYVGIEPDCEISLSSCVTTAHRCVFENAPLAADSIDLAFAVMVLEHIAAPSTFWERLLDVLTPGGVFWGFTVDARHPFRRVSQWTERLKIKDWYLDRVAGRRGTDRYENYPVQYLANTPAQIFKYVHRASSCDFLNFARVGQLDFYVPRFIRPLTRQFERWAIANGKPGILLAVRIRK